ncbi:MAG: hypothetical protein M1505_01220 [Patescibacteria group bacterium]|nr:hypothetical protein [Patescibacteria group bacterium]
MTNISFSYLYQEFVELLSKGDENEAKQFLVDHFNDLPKDVQDDIIMAFFEEGLSLAAIEADEIDKFQKERLEEVEVLEKIKKSLEDKIKLIDLKKEATDEAKE